MAPANVLRVIRLVRFGAASDHTYSCGSEMTGLPSASSRPSTWWQREHWAMNVCSPVAASVSASGGSYSASWLAFQASKSAASRATTSMRMLAWDSPQNSVHWPA